jgi:hypothetical protein
MISTDLQRVQIQDIVESQLPSFVREDFPLITDFLKQYYVSQEYPGSSVDLIQNIDQYLKLETLTYNSTQTEISSDISFADNTINVTFDLINQIFGTNGFPERYGLIQINDEIILYTEKTSTSFTGCIRGFSGVTSYTKIDSTDKLTFSTSEASDHSSGSKVINLSALLLIEFLKKIKNQFTPGFNGKEFDDNVNEKLFISRAKDFYQSKGTDNSFKILFAALYGENIEVIKPKDYLFKPSDAGYRVTKDIVVESLNGNPLNLLNKTLFQDANIPYEIPNAYASITDVEKLFYNNKEYYKLSLDFDYSKDIILDGSLFGEFSVHPITKIINNVSVGSSIIDVDSTVGFPNSGELVVTFSSGNSGILTYRSKNINQFFDVSDVGESSGGVNSSINSTSDIRLNVNAYGYVGFGTTSRVEVRIGSVLTDLITNDETYYYSNNDTALIKSLGIEKSNSKTDNWIYNISIKFDVKSILLINTSDFTYNVSTYAKNNFRIGDNLQIKLTSSIVKDCIVVDVIDPFTISVRGQGTINGNVSTIERKILKPKVNFSLLEYSYIENYFSNIQNNYVKFNGDVLVASSSFPNYYNQPLNFYDRKITLNGQYEGELFTINQVSDHGYYTGDAVYYKPYIVEAIIDEEVVTSTSKFDNLNEGIYYVKRINENQFKISTSQVNLYNNNFVSVSGIVTSNTFEYVDFNGKTLQHQKLLREIKSPNNESGNYITSPGRTGILVNGVEILNYKSEDVIYYGSLQEIEVTSKGNDYDVINPPILTIIDDLGIGATANCSVKGSLKKIEIINSGFDYLSKPIITITGGNGTGAKASVNTTFIDHFVSFNATSESGNVILSIDSIGFSTYHKFRNAEKIIYKTDGQIAISGLATDAEYFVKTIDAFTVKLFKNEGDAISGVNTVSLTSFGEGVHRLQSYDRKQIISNIIVEDSGLNYENKKRIIGSSGIKTESDQINIKNHQYNSGEIVQYTFTQNPIVGLSSNTSYIITKIDEDNFKLSNIGIGNTSKLFYYNTKQFITLESAGSGEHIFNYEPISVTVEGKIGVTTFSDQNFNAEIQPIFRGSIESVQLVSGGSNYGTSEILNYNRQPLFNLSSGSGAELLPIVNNGRIVEVLITNGGSGYNSPPDLVVIGNGNYAKLSPVIQNGRIVDIKIESPGIGYENKIRINVISSGNGAKFTAKIQKWTVNLFQKYLNIISDDDGVLSKSYNENFGIQYTHLYAPRKLRESVYSKNQDNEIKYGIFDLQKVNEEEVNSLYHSPIIGWSYDGNPIYGPYGFSSITGGSVRSMVSGYDLVSKPNRPPFSQFPQGFFVEDYEFTNSGDLDEHNGRFCVTPDYPNGVYAYFSTINPGNVEASLPFKNYKIPQFPYFIGNSFKSKPNEFNFKASSNQISYNLNNSEWFRYTLPYGLSEDNSYYDYLFQPNKIKQQKINIINVSKGNISNVGIITGGFNYKVNDSVIFDNQIGSQKAKAKVTDILGKPINTISVASITISELEILPFDSNGTYIAFSNSPHNLLNNDLISLSGFNTSVNYLNNTFNVGVKTESFILKTGVSTSGVTGIVTYFSISGIFDENIFKIRENNILNIGDETVKVLNVDVNNSRIRVLRSYNSTVSSAHSASTVLREDSRKFSFTSLPENQVLFEINNEIYFDPKESLGIGSVQGVGIGTTISFANPGAGITQIFIPTQSIYLPNHNLNTGDILSYQTNEGDPIAVSTNGISSFDLTDSSILYVGKISNDLIGISTYSIGIGSTGTFVGIASTTSNFGLLFFTGIGTGVYHSFKTVKQKVTTAEAFKNIVTVSTASTHGLNLNDKVSIDVIPSTTTNVVVKYNDYNRRIVFNPKSFISADINTVENSITIIDHGLVSGDKVIHTSSSPSGGLENEKIYYVLKVSKNKIKLCLSKYETTEFTPNVVNITSSSFGTLSQVNPKIFAYKNTTINFNLSDSSLSSQSGSTLYSAFDVNLYADSEFKNKFDSSGKNNYFEVSKIGQVGITSNASLQLKVTNDLPEKLYYKFVPINLDFISQSKKEIYVDVDVKNNNEIEITNSNYSGEYTITGIGSTFFAYNISEFPESTSYDISTANLKYSTSSLSASGSIENISITYGGNLYNNVIGISSINSSDGFGAILETSSVNIGKILTTEIEDIGFDFPTDKTLRPIANLPEILLVDSLSSFDEIGISSVGNNYTLSPSLVVIDGFTGNQIKDVDLKYNIGDSKVKILKNSFGINNVIPQIIPIENSNGVEINNITYNPTTKEVTVGLGTGFSDSAPFVVGDKVLIENVSVGVGSTGTGYNSSNYNYALFTLNKVYIPLGGNVGIVTYSLDGYLEEGKIPGNYDNFNSAGRIIAQKDFPIFDIKLKKNNFILGETVISQNNTGLVENWNSEIGLLKISTQKDFNIDNLVLGQTSKTQGIIKEKIDFNAEIKTSAVSIVKKGWNKETGFLNYNTERIQDNNYYQNFSYSIKSKVPFEIWEDSVSSLNHAAGFLKFSDLIIESNDSIYNGVFSDYSGANVDITTDISNEIEIDCYSNFDLVTENSLNIGGVNSVSNEIYFNSKVLTDYFESFGNRVLTIDDISTEFNDTPRPTRFSIVDTFELTHRSKKYITYIRDKRFSSERQVLIVNILQDGSFGFLNQYGRVESVLDLGSFDFNIFGNEGQLLFYPTKYEVNNYNLSFVSFDIIGVSTLGIGSTSLGDVVDIKTTKETIPSSTTGTIVSIATTYRSSKILVELSGNNGEFEYDELNLIHDGANVEFLEYGQLTNDSLDEFGTSGLGTYNAYISGANIILDFTPKSGVAVTANTLRISIANTSSSGVGTQYLGFDSENIAFVNSSYIAISSSPTPTENIIASYNNTVPDDHNCSYYLISVEDTTNNRYEMSEVIVLNENSTAYITQYGNLVTHSGLGTVGAGVASSTTNLYFTPVPNIDAEVRVFQTSIQLVDIEDRQSTLIDLNNASISAGHGFYEGTSIDVKRAFELYHKQRPIFLRNFNGGSSSTVNVFEDTITIPEHFFVTGEEVTYLYDTNNSSPIGIASTSFVGVGTTNILPSSIFVIRVNEQKIKLARSAEDALKSIPISLDITNVGVGTYHTFIAKNQNTKCLIAIDNFIQSPIVSTSVTTGLTTHIGLVDDIIKFSGITSFFGGDLIKIDDEIMLINTVGLGSTNSILVTRPWMGTGLSTHSEYSTVTKVTGNYNIVDNTINFITAPKGPIPIGSSTNSPDERDWTGITTFSKFQGRTFIRSAPTNSTEETYSKNYIFDDISQGFDATQKIFTLQVDKQNVTGFSTNNAVVLINGIFQGPTGQLAIPQDYSLLEISGITSITFAGTATSVSYDPNNASIPKGGIIVSVGSTKGIGYQPLVSAGGTAIVSVAGTISSISIGNSGSGYRSGIQTTVNVGVYTSSLTTSSIEFIGTAAILGGHVVSVAITNPGIGYTLSNPPQVIFDAPLSYSNIPLIYSSESSPGFGTGATIDIVVGQGSSVIDFEIKNSGYNYGQSQILTIPSGGSAGIPTDPNKPFNEFQITIDKTATDEFAAWHFGQLEVLDKIENQFDGIKQSFTISVNSSPVTIRSAQGSNIDVQSTLLVFLNDILQVPGEAYTFTGGSVITFTEPPKGTSSDGSIIGDKCKILFYKGSGDVDVVFRDVLETIKAGDNLTIKNQDQRLITNVVSTDTVKTNPYSGGGIDANSTNKRTVEWCKQKTDKVINGKIVSKSRVLNEALINPSTNVIQSVGVGSTIVYVESVKSFFDSVKENQTTPNKQKIILVSQDTIVGASATAIVSIAGTISSIIINEGGVGYSTTPNVTIGNPVGLGTTWRASAISTVSIAGTVSSINISSPGIGYTATNSPEILVEVPPAIYEINTSNKYDGDFGIIVGISTTSVGVASTGLVFDLFIPPNSYLRDTSIVGSSTTISGIQTGYYFITKHTNIGNGITSLYMNGSILGITTQFLDCVYEVASVSTVTATISGIGITYVRRVITNISDFGNISGIGITQFYGEFSWGRIELGTRIDPKLFNSYTLNGSSGISTSSSITRVQPLKYLNYI